MTPSEIRSVLDEAIKALSEVRQLADASNTPGDRLVFIAKGKEIVINRDGTVVVNPDQIFTKGIVHERFMKSSMLGGPAPSGVCEACGRSY